MVVFVVGSSREIGKPKREGKREGKADDHSPSWKVVHLDTEAGLAPMPALGVVPVVSR